MKMREYLGKRIELFEYKLQKDLESVYMGKKVSIYGLDHSDGHTWKNMEMVVDRIEVSSCHEVMFNSITHHSDHEVVIL